MKNNSDDDEFEFSNSSSAVSSIQKPGSGKNPGKHKPNGQVENKNRQKTTQLETIQEDDNEDLQSTFIPKEPSATNQKVINPEEEYYELGGINLMGNGGHSMIAKKQSESEIELSAPQGSNKVSDKRATLVAPHMTESKTYSRDYKQWFSEILNSAEGLGLASKGSNGKYQTTRKSPPDLGAVVEVYNSLKNGIVELTGSVEEKQLLAQMDNCAKNAEGYCDLASAVKNQSKLRNNITTLRELGWVERNDQGYYKLTEGVPEQHREKVNSGVDGYNRSKYYVESCQVSKSTDEYGSNALKANQCSQLALQLQDNGLQKTITLELQAKQCLTDQAKELKKKLISAEYLVNKNGTLEKTQKAKDNKEINSTIKILATIESSKEENKVRLAKFGYGAALEHIKNCGVNIDQEIKTAREEHNKKALEKQKSSESLNPFAKFNDSFSSTDSSTSSKDESAKSTYSPPSSPLPRPLIYRQGGFGL